MKKLFFILIIFIVSCGNSVTELTDAQKTEVLKYSDPIADTILEGLNKGEYAKYSKDFDETMRKSIPEAAFTASRELIQSIVGSYKTRKVSKILEQEGHIIVLYNAEFEKEKDVNIKIVFKKNAAKKEVSGLWFNSPKLSKMDEITGEQKEKILEYAEPIVDNLLQALSDGNYEKYTKDFDENIKKAVTQEVFSQARDKIQAKIGAYKSKKIFKVLKQGNYHVVAYIAVFEKEEEVKVTTTLKNNLVAGHVLDSPKLRK